MPSSAGAGGGGGGVEQDTLAHRRIHQRSVCRNACVRSSRSEGSVGEAGPWQAGDIPGGGNAPGSWLWEVRARATLQPRDRQAGFWQQGSRMVLGEISTGQYRPAGRSQGTGPVGAPWSHVLT